MGYPIPGIPKFSDVKYSPPIVNLKPLRLKIARQMGDAWASGLYRKEKVESPAPS